MAGRYSLITVFHDEERTLPLVIESIKSQTLVPDHWFLLDDSSADGGPRIVSDFVSMVDFASYHLLGQTQARPYMRYSIGVRAGWDAFVAASRDRRPPYWGILDADITVAPEYFATLVGYLDSTPLTAVVSGDLTVTIDGEDRLEDPASVSPRGGARLMRVDALAAINGPPVVPFCDTAIDVKLQHRGWKLGRTRKVHGRHFRRTNAKYGRLEGFRLVGEGAYVLKFSPLAIPIIAVVKAVRESSPTVARAYVEGFLRGWLANIPRIEDPELVQYNRTMPTRFVRSRVGSFLMGTTAPSALEQNGLR